MMNKRFQQGLSLFSTFIVMIILALAVVMGIRAIPAIKDYMALQRIVATLAQEGDDGATADELRASFERQAQIDNITVVTAADLEIEKIGGRTKVEAEYDYKFPIVGKLSLDFEISVSSKKR